MMVGTDPGSTAVAVAEDEAHRPAWPGRRRRKGRRPPPLQAKPLPIERLNLGSPLRAARRLALYLTLIVVLTPVQAILVGLRLPWRVTLPFLFHRLCWRVFGLTVVTRGEASTDHPTLFVANHTSYVDIPVLGALLKASFVAKSEVAGYPVFGILAKLQRTVFVDRKRGSASRQRDQLTERLRAGENLILFPEGTSNDGNRVLPFKSALFAAAEVTVPGPEGERPVTVQPVSIAYTRLDGLPMGRHLRPNFAWYGDMDMAPHIWSMLGMGTATVVVTFHPPVTIADFDSRKAMARHCGQRVAIGVAESLSGRSLPAEDGGTPTQQVA